jgi:glutamate synthase domain-containing protein 2
VCIAMRSYFEDAEHKRNVLTKWNALSLQHVMNKNEKKTIEECLQIMLKELRHLQHELDSKFQTNQFLHNKLVIACRNVSACRYACYKSSESVAELISDLRSSIVTHNESHVNEFTFFTDRKYHKQSDQTRTLYSKSSNSKYSSRNDASRNYSSRTFTSYDRDRRSSYQQKKKCFVCDKEGCWSTRHIRDEKDQTMKRHRASFSDR